MELGHTQLSLILIQMGDEGNRSPPQAQQRELNAQQLAEALRPYLPVVTDYAPPVVQTPQYKHQVDVNSDVIRLLMGSTPDKVELAIKKLKERNSLLAIAESNPTAFKMAENLKSFQEIGKGADNALLSTAMMMSAMSQPAEKRKRQAEPSFQPFHSRGVEDAYSAPQPYPQATYFYPQQQFQRGYPGRGGSSSRGGQRFRSSPPCFHCGEPGHFMSNCPNKRYGSEGSFSFN